MKTAVETVEVEVVIPSIVIRGGISQQTVRAVTIHKEGIASKAARIREGGVPPALKRGPRHALPLPNLASACRLNEIKVAGEAGLTVSIDTDSVPGRDLDDLVAEVDIYRFLRNRD